MITENYVTGLYMRHAVIFIVIFRNIFLLDTKDFINQYVQLYLMCTLYVDAIPNN